MLIVQQYEQEKITRMIVILKNEKHILVVWLIKQHKDKDSSGKKSPTLFSPCICMNLRLARIFAAFIDLQSYRSRKGRISDASRQNR